MGPRIRSICESRGADASQIRVNCKMPVPVCRRPALSTRGRGTARQASRARFRDGPRVINCHKQGSVNVIVQHCRQARSGSHESPSGVPTGRLVIRELAGYRKTDRRAKFSAFRQRETPGSLSHQETLTKISDIMPNWNAKCHIVPNLFQLLIKKSLDTTCATDIYQQELYLFTDESGGKCHRKPARPAAGPWQPSSGGWRPPALSGGLDPGR
jgi:hypothetical protein